MKFLPPVFLFLFSLVFFSVWLLERRRFHLVLFGLAFLLASAGAAVQLARFPADQGYNAVLSSMFYTSGILCFARGVLLRSERSVPYKFDVLFFCTIIGGTIYYYYIDENLLYRIYIINLGIGAILLTTAYKARFLLRASTVDKVLFWLIFCLGVHFFPRTFFTAENITNAALQNFGVNPFWSILQFTITVAGVGMGLGLLAITFADIIIELRGERDTDPLTGLANRRLFAEHIDKKLAKRARQNKPMCFAIIDVDHFKLYNDRYGHNAGDLALKKVAHAISLAVKQPEDIAARIGGEEFGMFFYGRTMAQTKLVLELTRNAIAALDIEHQGSPVSDILTVSIGVAEFVGDEDFESLFQRADRLLYRSKATGRDQVTMA